MTADHRLPVGILAVPLVPFVLLILTSVSAAAQSPLDRIAWLGGCWQAGEEERATIEMWLPPDGGLMVGASRTVSGGRARAWEHLRLREDGEHLVYTAIPSGQTETDFRSTAVSDSSFTVENLEHDFPQRITYSRTHRDVVTARVEGRGPDGPRGFEITFRRVACEARGDR